MINTGACQWGFQETPTETVSSKPQSLGQCVAIDLFTDIKSAYKYISIYTLVITAADLWSVHNPLKLDML